MISNQGFFNENLQLHNSPFLVSSLPPLPSLPFPSLPFLSLPPPPFSPSLLAGVRGYHPRKIFGITDARGLVLEHFGHKNQHRYEPRF